jgi:CDP-glucose 4,6-dehydratase
MENVEAVMNGDNRELSKARAWERGFWQGKRVLLTGHTGFKGAWLALWLHRAGAQVTGFSLPAPAAESAIWRNTQAMLTDGGLADLRGDIRDRTALDAAIAQSQPEIVFHLAAQAIVLDSYQVPEETWDVNVMGTLHALQAVARHSQGHGNPVTFLGITSDKCYENREWSWGYRENDPLGGKDPYSASKAACELLLASWRHSFGAAGDVRVASARAGNVIGGGDSAPHRIVPDVLEAFSRGVPVQVRNPRSTRPYQHVLEPLSGYLLLARFVHEQGARFEQAYNFGPDANGEKSTEWLATTAARLWGSDAQVTLAASAVQAHEAGSLMLDSGKARKELGWAATWQTADALAAAIAWHRAAQAGNGVAEAQRQIELYETQQPFVAAA